MSTSDMASYPYVSIVLHMLLRNPYANCQAKQTPTAGPFIFIVNQAPKTLDSSPNP